MEDNATYSVQRADRGWLVIKTGIYGGKTTVAKYRGGAKGSMAARELADMLNAHKDAGLMA